MPVGIRRAKKKKDEATQRFINSCSSFADFGGELKRRRTERKMIAEDVANELGIGIASIYATENGRPGATLDKLQTLGEFFGIPSEFTAVMVFKHKLDSFRRSMGLGHLDVSIDWTTARTFTKDES